MSYLCSLVYALNCFCKSGHSLLVRQFKILTKTFDLCVDGLFEVILHANLKDPVEECGNSITVVSELHSPFN